VPGGVKGELTATMEFQAEPYQVKLTKTTFTIR